jgi:hypothetical protein
MADMHVDSRFIGWGVFFIVLGAVPLAVGQGRIDTAKIVLVLVGGYLLLRAVVPQVDQGGLWPLVLGGVGIALLVASIRPGSGGRPVD